MKISSFLLIFGFATPCINASIAFADPGCLKVIQGKAIDEKTAKLLPKDCQAFRIKYLQGLKLLSERSEKFSHEMAKKIAAKKSFEPPYDELVLSMFPSMITNELKQAIEARAKIEISKNFKYKYALAANEKLTKGTCSSTFSEPAYDEICGGQDLAYSRIEKLHTVKSDVKK